MEVKISPNRIVGNATITGTLTINGDSILLNDTMLERAAASTFHIHDSAGSAYGDLRVNNITVDTSIIGGDNSYVIRTNNNVDAVIKFQARDDGALSTVGEIVSVDATDACYFGFGGSNEHKFYNDGTADLGDCEFKDATGPIQMMAYSVLVASCGQNGDFWPFINAGATTAVEDYHVNANDGVASENLGSWDTAPAYVGSVYAYTFNGTDELITVADAANLSTAGAFSVGAWVNMTDATSSTILAKWDTTLTKREFKFHLDSSDYLTFTVYDETNDATVETQYQTGLSQGSWHYVVGTFDGGADASGLELYIDGEIVSTVDTVDDAGFANLVDQDTAMTIGCELDNGAAANLFDGKMWGPFYSQIEIPAYVINNIYLIGKGLLNQ